MSDLGTLPGDVYSEALGVNDIGQVVGTSSPYDPTVMHGFVYSNGAMTNLNSLLPAGAADWQLTEVFAINNSGQIAGDGVNPSGDAHGFIIDLVTDLVSPARIATTASGLAYSRVTQTFNGSISWATPPSTAPCVSSSRE